MPLATAQQLYQAAQERVPNPLLYQHLAIRILPQHPLTIISRAGSETLILETNSWHSHIPIHYCIKNLNKLSSLGINTKDLDRDLLYHWLTNFHTLKTREQIKAALLCPQQASSYATTLAVNKYIEKYFLTKKQTKNLLSGSPYRWIDINGLYIQKTFYTKDSLELLFNPVHRHHEHTIVPTNHQSFLSWLRYINNYEEEVNINTLKPHNTKATDYFPFKVDTKKQKDKTPIFLGIELEFENFSKTEFKTLNILKNHAIFKTDGSLSQGVEICSAPATLDIHKQEFQPFFEGIERNKSKLTALASCGLHVHIDKKALSNLHRTNIYLFINNVNNKKYINAIAGREPNRFCEAHNASYSHFTEKNPDFSKYRQVNLSPPYTIELRLFASTTNYNKFISRLEFSTALVNYTRPGTINIPITKIPLWEHFATYLTQNKKEYPTLVKELSCITLET